MQWLMGEKLEWTGMEDVAEPSKPLISLQPMRQTCLLRLLVWTMTKMNLTPIMTRQVEVFLAALMARAIVRGIWNLWVVGYGFGRHMSKSTFQLTLSLEISSSMANTAFSQTL